MANDDAARRAELVLLRKVRDRIDRDYAQPLDVDALARGAHLSAGHLSRAFKALQKHGLVIDGNRITIRDRAALETYAQPDPLIDDRLI